VNAVIRCCNFSDLKDQEPSQHHTERSMPALSNSRVLFKLLAKIVLSGLCLIVDR
jgi:hypothetical protein